MLKIVTIITYHLTVVVNAVSPGRTPEAGNHERRIIKRCTIERSEECATANPNDLIAIIYVARGEIAR
jgi:hypothetical protein